MNNLIGDYDRTKFMELSPVEDNIGTVAWIKKSQYVQRSPHGV